MTMKWCVRMVVVVAATIAVTISSAAQGEAAVPFLLITSSPEGNGMGGISASIVTDNAMAASSNPAQVGLFGLRGHFNAGFYTRKTQWLPMFQESDLTYNAGAVSAGFDLGGVLSLPFPVGIGAGYSKISPTLGTFVVTGPSGPTPIATLYPKEEAEAYSIGVGFDYVVKIGSGFNFKRILSDLPYVSGDSVQPAKVEASATDFGLIVHVPLSSIISKAKKQPLTLLPETESLIGLTVAYVRSNVGEEVQYVEAFGPDPLPRQGTIGVAFELGLVSRAISYDWKVFSMTWARQADDVLVRRSAADRTFSYQSGLGDIQVFKNLLLGEPNGRVGLRKGWEVSFAELISIRGGSYSGAGNLIYSTSGYSLRLGGLFKLIGRANRSGSIGTMFAFAADHLSFEFHYSRYGSTESPVRGTTFQGFNVVLR